MSFKRKKVQESTEAQGSKSVKNSTSSYQPVDVEDIGLAEIEIIRCLQHKRFKDEIKAASVLAVKARRVY